MNEKVITSIVFPKELWEKMKRRAFNERVSLGELVRQAVTEFLAKKQTTGGKKK